MIASTNLPQSTANGTIDCALHLIPKGTVTTLLGRVAERREVSAKQIGARLDLSMGSLPVVANSDVDRLCLDVGRNLRIKLLRSYGSGDSGPRVLSAVDVGAWDVNQTSWIPTTLYHRFATLARLRGLLGSMSPGLQGAFMSLMIDAQVQRRFYWRPAATDHHCYPGGLVDVSVAAAVAADAAAPLDADGELATLAALLFDIGKVFDSRLLPDAGRRWMLMPHAQTGRRLTGPLARLAQRKPKLAHDLNLLTGDFEEPPPLPDAARIEQLRQRIRSSVESAWSLFTSGLSPVRPGASA